MCDTRNEAQNVTLAQGASSSFLLGITNNNSGRAVRINWGFVDSTGTEFTALHLLGKCINGITNIRISLISSGHVVILGFGFTHDLVFIGAVSETTGSFSWVFRTTHDLHPPSHYNADCNPTTYLNATPIPGLQMYPQGLWICWTPFRDALVSWKTLFLT